VSKILKFDLRYKIIKKETKRLKLRSACSYEAHETKKLPSSLNNPSSLARSRWHATVQKLCIRFWL